MDIVEQKRLMREEMVSKRKELDVVRKAKYDYWVSQQLINVVQENGYESVHCFIPMIHEIDIYPFIKWALNQGVRVVCPKTLPNRKLLHLVLNSLDELDDGKFGTQHPSSGVVYIGQYDLIVVPGLAFDSAQRRLGYGGGYYDTFLTEHIHANKVGIFYPFQEVENVPIEEHDISLDNIIVNKQIISHTI